MVQRQHGRHRLHTARATEQVTDHRLGRGDRDVVGVVAEDLAQRLQLGDVTRRRRGGVRVHMHDLRRVQVGAVEQVLQGVRDAPALRLRLDDVVGVRGDALADRLRVDAGTALGGVLGGLQDEHTRALAEDEAVPVDVVGARGALGVLVVLRHRHHVAERGDGQRVDRRLRTAGDDHVGTTGADHLDGVADGLGTRGARRDRRVHARAGAHEQAHVGRGAVRHQHGDGVRGDAADALLLQHVVLVQQGGHAADAGGYDRAEPVRVDGAVLTGLAGETGVLPGLLGRDQRELRRAVQTAGLRPRDDLGRLHGHRSGDADGLVGRPLLGQGLHAGLAGDQALPGRGYVATQRCGCADTGDDHGAIGRAHGNSFSNGTRIRTAPPPGGGAVSPRL